MNRALTLICLTVCLSACVPKAQYDTLVTERDYYREQKLVADSLATLRTRTTNDSIRDQRTTERDLVKRIEDLTATNLLLQQQLAEVQSRYNTLFQQNSELLAAGSNEMVDLRQQLLDRSTELDRREAMLEQRDRQLEARETQLTSLERPRTPAPAVTEELSELASLHDRLQQDLLASVDSGYVLSGVDNQKLSLTLAESLLFDGDLVHFSGRQLLRRIAATLRRYPSTTYTLIGHTDSSTDDATEAYQRSSRRAALVAEQLVAFGIDPARIVAGGKGFYGARNAAGEIDDPGRTELIIRYREE